MEECGAALGGILVESVFGNPHMPIAILDREWNYVAVNEACATFFDMSAMAWQGRNISESPLASLKIAGTGVEYPSLLTHPEKTLTPWQCFISRVDKHVVLILIKPPSSNGLSASLQEISQRKRTEASLRLSEEKFAAAFRSSPVMISIRRLEDSVYIDVNEQWLKSFGYSPDEIIGKSTYELNLIDEETKELTRRIETTQIGVRSRPMTYRTKTGEIRDAINSLEVINLGGELCMFSVTLDTTEQRAMEREMQRLDRFNLIGQMASGLGHEIRNPLTTVRGFLQLFTSRYPDEEKHFALMISEIDRANRIITEFLSLSRTRPSNLSSACLNSIIKTMHPMINAHAIQVDRVVSLELGDIPPLLLDESEIRQVLLNLVSNAIDASPPGETVVIRTFSRDLHVVLEVEDAGSGVSPSIAHQLGTPFLTTKSEGTGLGLAITYTIVRRHGGKVDFRSSDKGTVFAVSFPRANDCGSG
jgi:PAS domain S-box-containing protein